MCEVCSSSCIGAQSNDTSGTGTMLVNALQSLTVLCNWFYASAFSCYIHWSFKHCIFFGGCIATGIGVQLQLYRFTCIIVNSISSKLNLCFEENHGFRADVPLGHHKSILVCGFIYLSYISEGGSTTNQYISFDWLMIIHYFTVFMW